MTNEGPPKKKEKKRIEKKGKISAHSSGSAPLRQQNPLTVPITPSFLPPPHDSLSLFSCVHSSARSSVRKSN